MAFGSDNEKIKLTLDAEGVVKELKGVGDQLERIGDAASGAGSPVSGLESAFSSFGANLITVNQALDLAGRAFGFIKDTATVAIDAIKRGSSIADVSDSFSRLASAAGTTATVFQDQLVKATGETIANFDLQKAAIESLRAGVKPDEFLTLTQAARALAEQTGGDTKQAIDELSKAFETGQVRALQNKLGILDLQAAEDAFAAKLGTTSDKLTAQQQVLAARNALLDASKAKIAEVGQIESDAADNIDRLSSSLANTRNQFIEALGRNQELNIALATLAETVQKVDLQQLVGLMSELATTAAKAATEILNLGQKLIGTFSQVIKLNDVMVESRNRFGAFNKDGIVATLAMTALKETVGKVATALVTSGSGAEVAGKALDKVANRADNANKKVVELNKVSKESKTESKASADAIDSWAAALGIADESAYQTTFTVEQLRQSIASLGGADALDPLTQAFDSLQSTVASGLGNALSAALEGDKAGIKASVRQIGSDVGRSFGTAIAGPIGGELGAIVGDKLGKAVFDAFNHVFGGRDAQGAVRDNLDKFFADLLTDNPALINFEGKLKSIFDLEFLKGTDAYVTGTFDDLLQGLSDSAQATFSGIAAAFSQFVEGAADQSGQLAAVLANNLGGSLNNLQLLVQASGKSFEDLRNIVVEAFLDGKLSADEALNALGSIEQIATKGIPGAIGAVDEAFKNLQASGTKGGRAVVDALQDIGSEARELGVKDFGQLAALIQEKTGASAEDVQKLFDALTSSGITSIEQLENATTEKLLPVISKLGQADFPFAEAADEAQTLIDKVNDLPDQIQKKVIFNVETRADRNSQELIDRGVIPNFGNAGEGT